MIKPDHIYKFNIYKIFIQIFPSIQIGMVEMCKYHKNQGFIDQCYNVNSTKHIKLYFYITTNLKELVIININIM